MIASMERFNEDIVAWYVRLNLARDARQSLADSASSAQGWAPHLAQHPGAYLH